jgi:hypothetical protein
MMNTGFADKWKKVYMQRKGEQKRDYPEPYIYYRSEIDNNRYCDETFFINILSNP